MKQHWMEIVAALCAVLVAGCGSPGMAPETAAPEGDRQLLAAGDVAGFEAALAQIPAQLSFEEGAKVLVRLPADPAADRRYGIQQILTWPIVRGPSPFGPALFNELSYYNQSGYYMPYIRGREAYLPYYDVYYRDAVASGYYSPYYASMGNQYVPYTYRSDTPRTASQARHVVVNIRNFAYQPANLQLTQGGTVVWMNGDQVDHTATADDGTMDTGRIAPGATSRPITFSQAGQVPYHCTYHPRMKAMVTVSAP